MTITDEQSLISASRNGHSIPVYDDGYGPLFIHRDSMGISGIVRAQTWEDAYSICEDEFFPSADSEAGEEMERIEAMEDGAEKNHAQACWDESYGFRGNGRREVDNEMSHIYAKDLNGDSLEMLTPGLLAELEITLEITPLTTKQLHSEILASDIFRTDGPTIDLPAKLIELCDAIKAEDDTDWSIGESTDASLDNLIVGAYWALSEWHGGQSSDTYAALCALGSIFSPGMTSLDEESPEYIPYEMINAHFR